MILKILINKKFKESHKTKKPEETRRQLLEYCELSPLFTFFSENIFLATLRPLYRYKKRGV